jgi:PAS domain S-box-containing protein
LDGIIATTLPGYPATATNGAAPSASVGGRREIFAAAVPFFAITTDLGPSAAGLEMESALSVAEMRQEERRALLLLVAATAVTAAVVFGLGFALSRRHTRPLDRLTRSAQRIRQGDLDTPVPIPDGPGEIAALASTLEAGRVHTRATVETLLREKAWSEALILSVVEGIVTVDRAGRIATFSPGAERLTGWRAAEATGQAAANVFRTPDGSAFLEKLPPPGGRRAVQVVDRSGRTLTLSITDARFRLPSNGGERLALVMRDVSDDEAVRRLRSYFLANISHEFRTPLSAIHASVELLLEDLGSLSKDEIADLLHSVNLSMTGLQTLIDNLLESLSIEAGRFSIRRHTSTLDKAIDQSARHAAAARSPSNRCRSSCPRAAAAVDGPDAHHAGHRQPAVQCQQVQPCAPDRPERYSARRRNRAGLRRRPGRTLGGPGEFFRRFVRLEPVDPGQYGVGPAVGGQGDRREHGGRVGATRSRRRLDLWFSCLQGRLSKARRRCRRMFLT